VTRGGDIWIGRYRGGIRQLRHDGCDWWTDTLFEAAQNASFSVYSPRHDLHYLVDEGESGAIGVYRAGSGSAAPWTRLNCAATGGADPCHITLSRDETRLAIANYTSGSVSVFLLDSAGLPITPAQVLTNTGAGSDRERQTSPHAHWVGFDTDDRWLYAVDLGTDEILAFRVALVGVDAGQVAYRAPPGSGPRHLLLHPRLPGLAYLASELSSTLSVLTGGNGQFVARDCRSTLPSDFAGDNIVAHLAINSAGDRLYISNRGHDSIAVFALDHDGRPSLVQHAPAGAAYPRHVLIAEDLRVAIVANEKDACVTVLPIDDTGLLGPSVATIPVPGAAFVFRA